MHSPDSTWFSFEKLYYSAPLYVGAGSASSAHHIPVPFADHAMRFLRLWIHAQFAEPWFCQTATCYAASNIPLCQAKPAYTLYLPAFWGF